MKQCATYRPELDLRLEKAALYLREGARALGRFPLE